MKSVSQKKASKKRSQWIVGEGKYFTYREVRKLREAADALRQAGLEQRRFSLVRRWFLIELGLNTGMRVAEMASLDHSSLFLENGRSSVVVVGKGEKKRSIWINTAFKDLCRRYIEYRASFGYGLEVHSSLLNNLKGERISRRALQKDFKAILHTSGLPSHYYIHCLRHTYATHLLKASNYNYRFVQNQLGHASISTTQVYAGVVESDGRKAVEALYA